MTIPEVLSREVRAAILQRCLTNWVLIKRCYKYQRLLDQPVADLLDELGVKIYQALFYYRFTHRLKDKHVSPEEQAYKIAMQVGIYHLGDMVRAAMRQNHLATVPLDWFANDRGNGGRWASLRDTTASSDAVTEITNLIGAVATEFVGADKAGLLVRASLYDWQGHCRLSITQVEIMRGLGKRNRLQIRRLLDEYHAKVRAQLEPTPQLYLREEGVWRAAPQIVA